MTGVWMSDSSGFAVTPPRADADAVPTRPLPPPAPDTGAYERTANLDSEGKTADGRPPEQERMVARGDESGGQREPRIEQYRER
jgi:hypothetical protein